jgi:sugar/nucleoside kinase (ribokinase family)
MEAGMADLVIVGDCNPDVMVLTGDITPAFGQQEQIVPAISLVTGGSAGITAVAAARLGASVEFVAVVGDDAAGHFMLAELNRAGVGTSHVIVRDDLPTGMSVALSRRGDRAILTASGGIAALTAADIPPRLVAAARHVHLSSYFLMEDALAPGLAEVFAAARAAGTMTSLDTNWDPAGRWGGPRLRAVLAHTDLLLPNEAEALRISGRPTLDEAVAQLTATGAAIAVKRGGDGAILQRDGVRYRATPPPVTPVDTTGAGDCFNAGLITALLAGREPADALALACAAGAASTRALGGTAGAPDLPAALVLARQVSVQRGTPAG